MYKNQTFGTLETVTAKAVNLLNNDYSHDELYEMRNENSSAVHKIKADDNTKLEQLFDKLKIHEMTHLNEHEIDIVKSLIAKYQHVFYDEDKGLPPANLPGRNVAAAGLPREAASVAAGIIWIGIRRRIRRSIGSRHGCSSL